MAIYYKNQKDGVTAIVTEEVMARMAERIGFYRECNKFGIILPDALPPITPVFTFSLLGHPLFQLMTGTNDIMKRLLSNHDVRDGNFYVPFSNNNFNWDINDMSTVMELRYMTSLDQVEAAFGIKIGQ